ncbi:hypothetical protein B0H17DRAFT_395030 [Mycena rosella]|uniref:Uncharacterized protein n=1 Tax=Mycena rosella TaxID=1033263 RepID=A0AAD7CMQ4_MYCRO|nr:hypothetical protein B0H17DRAFT_395030 [Mycena rosella]
MCRCGRRDGAHGLAPDVPDATSVSCTYGRGGCDYFGVRALLPHQRGFEAQIRLVHRPRVFHATLCPRLKTYRTPLSRPPPPLSPRPVHRRRSFSSYGVWRRSDPATILLRCLWSRSLPLALYASSCAHLPSLLSFCGQTIRCTGYITVQVFCNASTCMHGSLWKHVFNRTESPWTEVIKTEPVARGAHPLSMSWSVERFTRKILARLRAGFIQETTGTLLHRDPGARGVPRIQ